MKKINNIIDDLLLLIGTVLGISGAIMLYLINYDLTKLIVIVATILILIKIYMIKSNDRKKKEVKQYEKSIYRKKVQN